MTHSSIPPPPGYCADLHRLTGSENTLHVKGRADNPTAQDWPGFSYRRLLRVVELGSSCEASAAALSRPRNCFSASRHAWHPLRRPVRRHSPGRNLTLTFSNSNGSGGAKRLRFIGVSSGVSSYMSQVSFSRRFRNSKRRCHRLCLRWRGKLIDFRYRLDWPRADQEDVVRAAYDALHPLESNGRGIITSQSHNEPSFPQRPAPSGVGSPVGSSPLRSSRWWERDPTSEWSGSD